MPGSSDSILLSPIEGLLATPASYGQPRGVPVWMHRAELAEVGTSLEIASLFDERAMSDSDLEVIPTPGHTIGSCCYLWDNGEHRFLFTGDFIWIEDGQWKAVVLDPDLRGDYLNSLRLVRDLDFDVLVPWGVTEEDALVWQVSDQADRRERIDAIIDRVTSGSNR